MGWMELGSARPCRAGDIPRPSQHGGRRSPAVPTAVLGDFARAKTPSPPSLLASVLAPRVATGDCPWQRHGKVRGRIKLFLEQSCWAPREGNGGDCLL